MKLKVGKLYRCEEYFLMLYPDPETADATTGRAYSSAGAAASSAAVWSNRFGKPISYVDKNVPILVLNDKKEYVEVLAGDRKGWIIDQDWLKIKEIV